MEGPRIVYYILFERKNNNIYILLFCCCIHSYIYLYYYAKNYIYITYIILYKNRINLKKIFLKKSEKLKNKLKIYFFLILNNRKTTLNNGYLGSRNDEERSEMRYVV